ncbi:hypothetical protein [Salmonella phage vB_SenM_C12]|uniref:Uncharacterized protein n=1 Tax=Salmonella phage vB_SenS_S528 TaxID=2886211 RepID=A0AAE8Y4M8_9CAUD|nr:hypothetical protein QA039_gp17 [Salmonella phage vB_SenS_S528]QIG57307.1 hypothetical protein [Salmonella phage vB_SpuP_Spp11]UDL14207.1 hypothetical protein [Salmonella phage vB_SenS_S528]WKK67925.1 hypothetical protein [Salmonella phage SP_4]WPK42282.1 hypothetical protein [Salmonella phage vB_SenM_C12]
MKRVCKETLRERIMYLESVSKLGLSMNEEFHLEAYKMLLERLEKESEQE